MPGFSNYLETRVLQWIFKQRQLPTPPTTLYISLHSGDPGDTGANEISGGAYARAQLNPDTDENTHTNWTNLQSSGDAQFIANNADVVFPQATANWNGGNPIQWAGIWDASTSGNFLGSLQAQGAGVVVLNGNTLRLVGGTVQQVRFSVD